MPMELSESRKIQLEKVSQFLCFLLRHKPEAASLNMNNEGWVSVEQLLRNISDSKKTRISSDELNYIVQSDEENRYAFSPDKLMLRCLQGHSLSWVKIDFDSYTPSEDLYHGTSEESVRSILKSGLTSRGRNLVHLSTSIKKASRVGKRHSKQEPPVILVIDKDAPIDFKISENGVVLVESVPPEYISIKERQG